MRGSRPETTRRPAGRRAFAAPGPRSALLLVPVLLLLSVPGCEDDGNPIDAGPTLEDRLAGDYTSRTEDFGGVTYWVRFAEGGEFVQLIARDNGLRVRYEWTWSVIDEDSMRVAIDGRGNTVSFAREDSTLTVVSDHESDTIVYTRSDGMPDPATWVREIEVLEEFAAPDDTPTDLAWDGTGLWFAGGFLSDSIRRLNPGLGMVVDSTLAVGHSGHGIAFDAGDFWVDDAGTDRIYRVDGSTGATLFEPDFAAPARIGGIAPAPLGSVWVSYGSRVGLVLPGGDVFFELEMQNPVNGLEVGPFTLESTLFAAVHGAGVARISSVGPLYRVTDVWSLPLVNIRGLAFDGTDWWLYVIDLRGDVTTRILRARLL